MQQLTSDYFMVLVLNLLTVFIDDPAKPDKKAEAVIALENPGLEAGGKRTFTVQL